jgi:membrane-associated protease RseP (regulator of RpoE activity)
MISTILEIVFLISFLSFVGIRLILKRKRGEIKIKKIIVFEYSNKYTKKIHEIVSKHKKIFKILGVASLISAPILTIMVTFFLIKSLIEFKPSVGLVLPTISGFKYPGPIISVPFWIWIIAIFIIVFSHESMHALIANSEGVRTRKYGMLYLFVLPIGAFVDIDEKKLNKSDLRKKIKIFAAGSFGNILAFALFLLIIFIFNLIFVLSFESKGVWFNNTIEGSPAESVKLRGIILKINDQKINNVYDLQKFLKESKPNTTIIIETTEGKYTLTLSEKDNVSYIGIYNVKDYIVYKGSNNPVSDRTILILSYIYIALSWIAFLNVGIALANMLPIVPLDGGLIMREILKKKFGNKNGEKLSNILSTIFFILLIFSIFLSSLKSPILP